MFLRPLPLPGLPPRRKPRKGPRRSAGSEHRGGILRHSTQYAFGFISGNFDDIPVGIVIIPTVSVLDSGPSRNTAGVCLIYETDCSCFVVFSPKFPQGTATPSLSS